ncbi:hypothetical protein BGZ70_002977 [Mortierella alpina]|uniref:Pentatricopeptide repeat protein n=1 Tax=Mortierella alpina TaxID=64518 RepID=A0A9P6IT46_MORAP|nr:hypothetical protein BGZ70_002977 [Mortierella alpina]
MPKPLPGGGLLLHGRRRHHPGPQDQDQLLFRTWNAVIQFSARHLFCPAHAQSASVSATAAAHVARAGSIAGAASRVGALIQPGVRTTTSRRTLSTAAVAVASDPPLYSSSGAIDHQQRATQFRQDTKLAPSSTSAAPSNQSIPAASTTATETAVPTVKVDDPSSLSAVYHVSAATSTPPAIDHREECKYHSKPTSWRFPTPVSTKQDPVRLWPSTSKALSKVYRALGQIKSLTSTTSPTSSTVLRSTLVYYNYLSRLQSTYDTVLISRRDTRTLFLLQGRERKTSENLEQLLRIAMDLIWLNEKERQKIRQRTRSPALRNGQDRSSSTAHVRSPADDFHGLRVSEYTVVMNWISSVNRAARPGKCLDSSLSPHDRPRPFELPRKSSHTSKPGESMDQAWAIWQDFLLTGMKPDVVLYTSLMDMLLKAKDFDRAEQIWQHMHRTDPKIITRDGASSPSATSSIPLAASAAPAVGIRDPVLKSLNLGTTVGQPIAPSASASTRRKPHFPQILEKDHGHRHPPTHSPNGISVSNRSSPVKPNLQTFSVLIQSHAMNRDLNAIVQIYKEIQHQSTDGNDAAAGQSLQQRRTNTVLLNQILRVLIDLGETSAAREIYADMRSPSPSSSPPPLSSHPSPCASEPVDGDYTTETATTTVRSTAASASASTRALNTRWSLHHLNSQRRAVWERETRERSLAGLASRPSYPQCPDTTTHRLMLRLAKQEGDVELEEKVLEELYS